MRNTIAIIGRANVGKSTLFNRLAGGAEALVSNIAGTTRDLRHKEVEWQNKSFNLIDTGGFLASQKTPWHNLSKKEQKNFKREAVDDIDKQVEREARKALVESEVVLFLVDAKEGINPQDKEIANYLRKAKKDIILVVNKCDSVKDREGTAEFYKLGLGEPVLISATSGGGIGDLLDIIIKKVKTNKHKTKEVFAKIAIVGKPNVGKSSLLNTLAGEDKYIVSNQPHTTREPNNTLLNFDNKEMLLIDTAGIRRKAKIEKGSLENLGVRMSFSALKKADIALLVLDVSEAISHQDLQLAKMIVESKTGVIIVANKYDLVRAKAEDEEKEKLVQEHTTFIRKNFPHLSWAPIIFISAKTGWNAKKILQLVLDTKAQMEINIPQGALSKFLKSIIKKQPPPRKKLGFGGRTKIKRAFITNFRQAGTNPPLFECEIGSKEKLPEEYRKYIINNLRAKFGFQGTPINLAVRYKKEN